MGLLTDSFAANQAATPGASPINSTGGGANNGMVSASVISGMSQIASSWINASRARSNLNLNAGLTEIDGRMIKASARVEIKRIRAKSDSLFSRQQALYAKAGVTFDGSPAAVMTKSLAAAEEDAIMTDINATYAATQKELEASNYRFQAKQQKTNAFISTTQSLMSMGNAYIAAQSKG